MICKIAVIAILLYLAGVLGWLGADVLRILWLLGAIAVFISLFPQSRLP